VQPELADLGLEAPGVHRPGLPAAATPAATSSTVAKKVSSAISIRKSLAPEWHAPLYQAINTKTIRCMNRSGEHAAETTWLDRSQCQVPSDMSGKYMIR
jgi:hypothetical protein